MTLNDSFLLARIYDNGYIKEFDGFTLAA